MCGIVGVLQYRSDVEREVRTRALRILFSEMMLKTEPRGDDATGLYQVHQDGDWMMVKTGEKVTDWLFSERGEDQVRYRDFMDTWFEHPQDLSAVVGHCRKATVGSRGSNNDDNHPFAVQLDERNAILGVHNGTLSNHTKIFEALKEHNLKRQGSVDSESLFHFLYAVSQHGTVPVDGEMLKYMGERIDGSYAVIAANSRFPNQVVTFRSGRPLEYCLIRPLNIVAIASEKKFIESALEKYEFARQLMDPDLPKLEHEIRFLVDRDYRIFDTSLEFPTTKLAWESIEKISEKGEMVKSANGVLSEWKSSTSTTKTSSYTGGSGHAGHGTSHRSTGATKGTATASKSGSGTGSSGVATARPQQGGTATGALPAQAGPRKGDDDAGTVVEAEIELGGDAKPHKAFQEARMLGLCPTFDMPREVAVFIGKKEQELEGMTPADLATAVCQKSFDLGYGFSQLDSKQTVQRVRGKARDTVRKMEAHSAKQRRAQNHIWELRQILTIFLALSEGGYPLNEHNLEIVLRGFQELSAERRRDVLNMGKSILADQGAQRTIDKLVAQFKEAERKKKGKAAQAE